MSRDVESAIRVRIAKLSRIDAGVGGIKSVVVD